MTAATAETTPAFAAKPKQKRSAAGLWFVLLIIVIAIISTAIWLHTPLPPPAVIAVSPLTHDGLVKASVLSDGSQLYVSETADGHPVISKIGLAGGAASVLPTPFSSVQGLAISHDLSALLTYASQPGQDDYSYWSLPLNGGTPSRLADAPSHSACWSRDGHSLVFVRGSGLFVAHGDGTQEHELTTVAGTPFYPRFAPDGQHIRFSISDIAQNSTSLWEISADGSGLHQLFQGWNKPSKECCGEWTSEGRYYVFQVTQARPANVTSLWALAEVPAGMFRRRASDKPVQLTTGPNSYGYAMPDPKADKLWAIGVQPAGELMKYDSREKKFVPILAGISATDLDVSPDGQWVAYVSIPEGVLWRSRIDGSDRLQLTQPPTQIGLPRWSPDGKQIAYTALQSGKPWKILLVSAQGGEAKELLQEDVGEVDANWSSDGTQMVFGGEWAQKSGIKLLDMKSHQLSRIPGSEDVFSPRWSPNGRYIAAMTKDFSKLMLYDFQTRTWTPWLVEPAGTVNYPSWSANSMYLYFEDLVTGVDTIRRVKVGQNQAERVLVVEGVSRYPGPFGVWCGHMPDGSTVVVSDRSTQEVYGFDVKLP